MATWSVVADIDSQMHQQQPDTNFGSATTMDASIYILFGKKSAWTRAIMSFDLSAFPGDVADITAAKLTVDVVSKDNTGEQVDFERCTRPATWAEEQVTWNEYSTGNSWTAGGGDKTAVDRVETAVPASVGILGILGFKTLVEDAINNRANILSLIMRMDDEANAGNTRYISLRTTETAAPQKPTLEITYTPPGAGRRSVPRSPLGETVRSAKPATAGRAFAGARTAQPRRPQRRRTR